MKKMLIVGAILIANFSFSQTIYTADGTITANRTVTLNGKTLNFVPATASPTVGNLFMNGTTGNIGLGTTTPTSRFQVNSGDISINSGKLQIGTAFTDTDFNWGIKCDKPVIVANSDFPVIQVKSTLSGVFAAGQLACATTDYSFSNNSKKGDVILRSTSGNLIITNESGISTDGNIKFATKANSNVGTVANVQMLIDKTGNVGIGTQTPDAKLAVNGIIHTKEVKVDLINWPDYVFDDKYDLPTLKEVETQIIEKGHLKDIPSAEEVEKDGVKLGEMNKLLLQKVEELTLYIIEINKDLQEVKTQLKKQ